MPRRPRLHLPGIPQHVIQRGNDRQPMFFSDDDYFGGFNDQVQKEQHDAA